MKRRLLIALPLAALLGLAVVAPWIWGNQAEGFAGMPRQPASAAHWLGTDALGRDVFARLMVATRLTLIMALAATALSVTLGLILGVSTALATKSLSQVGARTIDVLLAIPPIIAALLVVAIYGAQPISVVAAVAAAFVPQYARLSMTLAAELRHREFVHIARMLGHSRARVVLRHVLPHIAGPIAVLASVGVASSIIALSGLSFLGVGVQEPEYDWGSMLAAGLRDLQTNSAAAIGPSLAIVIVGIAAGLLGDAVGASPAVPAAAATIDAPAGPDAAPAVSASAQNNEEVEADPIDALPGEGAHGVITARAVDCRNLTVWGPSGPIVKGIDLTIAPGERVGLVGESGSGKTLTGLALCGLSPNGTQAQSDRLVVAGLDLTEASDSEIATSVALIPQDPNTALNPARKVGPQLAEVLRVHQGLSRRAAQDALAAELEKVGVPEPRTRLGQYPHELSGGLKQRALIGSALAVQPSVLIADEPTTALDVTVQHEVLHQLDQLTEQSGTALILISHDIGVVTAMCDRVLVMYAGRVVEDITTASLVAHGPAHPYTQALLGAQLPADLTHRDHRLVALPGRPPSPGTMEQRCSFAPRCPNATDRCLTREPALEANAYGAYACFHPQQQDLQQQQSGPQARGDANE